MIRFSKARLRRLTKADRRFTQMPLRRQVSQLAKFLVDSGNLSFQSQDIVHLFIVADLTNPNTSKPILPSVEQVEKAMQRAALENSIGVRIWRRGYYVAPTGMET